MFTAEKQTIDMLPDFFSVDTLAKILGISRATAYRMAGSQIPCLRIGRRIILSRDHILRWIDESMEVQQ